MKKLHLSAAIEVPLDLVTEKLAWIGVTGSGKSYGAMKTAEELWAQHAQFVVLDPVGVWYGLRLAKDGKAAGIPIPVFGGLHGDVPLESTGGALVADLIVDKDLSAVLDVSQFESDAAKARFVSDFAERFYHRKKSAPSAVHVFLEEAQEFVPQNPQPGEQMMLHRLHRMQKLGRNFGIGTSIITQRPQETSKKAINQAQTVFVFRLTGSQERKAVEAWVNEHGLEENLLDGLPKMETGTCHVWSPAWLKVFKTIRIAAKATFDASATPKVGERAAARSLAPIDLERIRQDMAATIEKAKADDPKELRARIAELQRQVKFKMPKEAGVKIERVEVPVLKDNQVKRLETALEKARKVNELSVAALLEVTKLVQKAANPMVAVSASRPIAANQKARANGPTSMGYRIHLPNTERILSDATYEKIRESSRTSMSSPQQRILAALVFLQNIGVEQPDKTQVALFVGVRPSSGSYANNLGALRSAGLISYPAPGSVALTPNGLAASPAVTVPHNTPELHAAVLGKLPRPQQAILQKILDAYPQPVSKDWLAEELHISTTSGSYANNLGSLRTLGAVTYPQPGFVRAADIMFIDGRN